MLTIKSRFIDFRNRQNEVYSAEDLTNLSKALITCDLVNFRGNIGRGFTADLAEKILDKTAITSGKVLVINDVTLHMTNELLRRGFAVENICLAYGKWEQTAMPSERTVTYNIMKDYIDSNFNEKLDVVSLKELFRMTDKKFDLIIANPPYGKIGANITKKIIDTVDFDEYVNLLPLKDYELAAGRHVDFDSITTFAPHSFSDADILTHAVKINKQVDETITTNKELCTRAFTVDKPMLKFMKANMMANHYAIDNIKGWKQTDNVKTTFCFHEFRAKSQHTCGMDQLDSKSVANEYNFNNNEIKEKTAGISGCLAGAYYSIKFNTELEKVNFVEFYKANRNFINRMIANQFIGVRDYAACWPKVDWTQSGWTVEKILKTVAAYTDDEVKAVIDTLDDRDWAVKDDESIERLFGEWM